MCTDDLSGSFRLWGIGFSVQWEVWSYLNDIMAFSLPLGSFFTFSPGGGRIDRNVNGEKTDLILHIVLLTYLIRNCTYVASDLSINDAAYE